jgi:hypothetical protein
MIFLTLILIAKTMDYELELNVVKVVLKSVLRLVVSGTNSM